MKKYLIASFYSFCLLNLYSQCLNDDQNFIEEKTVVWTDRTLNCTNEVSITVEQSQEQVKYLLKYWDGDVIEERPGNGDDLTFDLAEESSPTSYKISAKYEQKELDALSFRSSQRGALENELFRLDTGTVEVTFKNTGGSSSYQGLVVNQWNYGLFLYEGELGVFNWGPGSPGTWVGTGIYPDTNWHHAALTFKENVVDKSFIYYDGELVKTFMLDDEWNKKELLIGVGYGSSQEFTGDISDVRIWTVVRSQEDIAENMNMALIGTEPGLLAYYDFSDGEGSILTDKTSNNLDIPLFNVENVDWISEEGFKVCQDISEDIYLSFSCLIPTNDMDQNTLQISPNPTLGIVTFSKELSTVKIIDAMGRLVLEKNHASKIDLSNLSNGVYIIKTDAIQHRVVLAK